MKQTTLSVFKKRLLLAVMGILTIFAFWPTFSNDFVTWDDGAYVKENPYIEFNIENIKSTFSGYYMRHYHPLTMISLSLDNQIAGETPVTYHTTNLALHVANTFLVFFLILTLFGRFDLAIMTGLLFGVHPLHVESVAWISERKDLLFSFFYLASLITYCKFIKQKNWKFYAFSLGLFLLSLLSKAQAVSLVAALPLIDYVLDQKLLDKKIIINKIPYLVLALILGIVAFQADTASGSVDAETGFSFFQKLVLSAWALALYIWKSFLPINLLPYYPYPPAAKSIYFATFYILPVLYSAGLWFTRKNKILIWSMFFFAINLVLFLPAFTPARTTIIADRYGYLPVIATILVTCYGLLELVKKFPKTKYYAASFFIAYLGFFTVKNFQQTNIWENGYTLWTPVLTTYPDNHIAWHNRGNARLIFKDYEGALHDYNNALDLSPNLSSVHYNRANALFFLDHKAEAEKEYSRSLELNPEYIKALFRRGMLRYQFLNNTTGATKDLTKMIEIAPYDPRGYEQLSQIYLKSKNLKKTCIMLDKANKLGGRTYSNQYETNCLKK